MDAIKCWNRNYNLQSPSHRLTELTWGKEDNGSEASKLFVCDVQLSERFDQLLLDSESHPGHLYLCASQGDHKVVTCSININISIHARYFSMKITVDTHNT